MVEEAFKREHKNPGDFSRMLCSLDFAFDGRLRLLLCFDRNPREAAVRARRGLSSLTAQLMRSPLGSMRKQRQPHCEALGWRVPVRHR